MSEPCGCEVNVEWDEPADTVTTSLEFCPLHKAAPDLLAALERHFPEDLIHRADGLKLCRYCNALVSLDTHKPDCPRAAIAKATLPA